MSGALHSTRMFGSHCGNGASRAGNVGEALSIADIALPSTDDADYCSPSMIRSTDESIAGSGRA